MSTEDQIFKYHLNLLTVFEELPTKLTFDTIPLIYVTIDLIINFKQFIEALPPFHQYPEGQRALLASTLLPSLHLIDDIISKIENHDTDPSLAFIHAAILDQI